MLFRRGRPVHVVPLDTVVECELTTGERAVCGRSFINLRDRCAAAARAISQLP
jgi:hypothetical protein